MVIRTMLLFIFNNNVLEIEQDVFVQYNHVIKSMDVHKVGLIYMTFL